MRKKYTHSAEVRARLSQLARAYNNTPAGIAKNKRNSANRTGTKHSAETIEKMRAVKCGKNHPSWVPFKLIVCIGDAEPLVFVYDGDTPYTTCEGGRCHTYDTLPYPAGCAS